MKKAAIQLSANIIVAIIIAVVIFTMGLAIFTRTFTKVDELKSEMDAKTKVELTNLMSQGERVAVPRAVIKTYPSEKITTGIGILNINEELTEFTIKMTPSDSNINVAYFDKVTIQGFKSEIINMIITPKPSAKKGDTYSIKIEISTAGSEKYGGRDYNLYIEII